MSLKHGLLGLLNYEGAVTSDIIVSLFGRSLNHFWSAKASQIYRELSSMEEMGWIISERIIQEERSDKKVYSLTDEGKNEFISWLLSADIGLGAEIRDAFLMKVFFAEEIGKEDAIRLIGTYREAMCSILPSIKEAQLTIAAEKSFYPGKDIVSVYWSLTTFYGEMQIKTGIEWADKAIEILKKMPD